MLNGKTQVLLAMTTTSPSCNLHRMEEPKHKEIGARIWKFLQEKNGGNMSELARYVEVTPQAVQQWISGETCPRGKNLLKVADFVGRSPSEIQYGEGNATPGSEIKAANLIYLDQHPEYSAVKRVRFKLSAGVSGYEVEYLNGDRAPIFFRRDWLEKRNLDASTLMAVEVSGQSMETSLFDGDVVVVNVSDNAPRDGEVFAVNYDGELVIKRLTKDAGEWFLSSDNPDKRRFPNKRCDERTSIIGRIVHKQSERI